MNKLTFISSFGLILSASWFLIKLIVAGEFSFFAYFLPFIFGALFTTGVMIEEIKDWRLENEQRRIN